jgi:hypothetical protein
MVLHRPVETTAVTGHLGTSASALRSYPPTGAMHAPHIFAFGLRSGFPHLTQGGPYID